MKPEINYQDFEKLDLRVASILEVEDIEGADKLYKLIIDVGDLGRRIICAGIKRNYAKEELIGKKIIIEFKPLWLNLSFYDLYQVF